MDQQLICPVYIILSTANIVKNGAPDTATLWNRRRI